MTAKATIFAPDVMKFVGDQPGEGFLEWCERTAEAMASANTPEECAFARLMRAMMVATVESANEAMRRDAVAEGVMIPFVSRAALTAAVAAVMSCLKDETPTELLRAAIIEQLDFVLTLMAPGKTLGDWQ